MRRSSSKRLRRPEPAAALAERVGPAAPLVLDAAELAVRLRRTGAAHLTELRDGLVPAAPLLYVPELFARAKGVRATRQIAGALGEELGF